MNPTATPAWRSLQTMLPTLAETRVQSGSIQPIEMAAPDGAIFADFSRHAINDECRSALLQLATEMQLAEKRDAMFAGARVNVTEDRCVLHTALRSASTAPLLIDGVNVRPLIQAELAKMEAFSRAVRSGKKRGISGQAFTDIVNIGIGGSYLGPAFVCAALQGVAQGITQGVAQNVAHPPKVHFVANIDGADLAQTLASLNPATTLFTVTSKTFTTDETMTNARSAEAWLAGALCNWLRRDACRSAGYPGRGGAGRV